MTTHIHFTLLLVFPPVFGMRWLTMVLVCGLVLVLFLAVAFVPATRAPLNVLIHRYCTPGGAAFRMLFAPLQVAQTAGCSAWGRRRCCSWRRCAASRRCRRKECGRSHQDPAERTRCR